MKPRFIQGHIDLRHAATRAGDEAVVLSALTFIGSHGETVRVPAAAAFGFLIDGGSIPALAQPFVGNKWGRNIRAFAMHDWITNMQEVEIDGIFTPISFDDACRLLDEALVCCECNTVARWLIVRFVNTPIGKAIWNQAAQRTDAQRWEWNWKPLLNLSPVPEATNVSITAGAAATVSPSVDTTGAGDFAKRETKRIER